MGILDKVLGKDTPSPLVTELQQQVAALTKAFEEQGQQLDAASFDQYLDSQKSMSPNNSEPLNYYGSLQQDLDIATLQNLFVSEGWFYIVVNSLARTIASLPLKLERRTVTAKDGTQVETWADASGENEAKILRQPNEVQTAFEFWWLVMADLFSTGNAFIYVADATTGTGASTRTIAEALYRINPSVIRPIPSETKKYIDGYLLAFAATKKIFAPEQIIHIKFPNPVDPFLGLAPIVPVYKNVLIDRYSQEHMIRFYKQGARLGGVVKTTQKLAKDQLARLQRSFENDFTGRHNHHRTLVLPQGMDYSIIEQNPGETSLIEFQKANREPIMSAYLVPPVKVGLLDGATYANALAQLKIYFTDTIQPALTIVQQSLNANPILLPKDRGLRVGHDLSNIEALQENQKELAEIAKNMTEGGLSVNEIREKVWKAEPVKGGEVVPVLARALQLQVAIPKEPLASPTPVADPSQPAAPGAAPVEGKPVEQSQNEAAVVSQIALNGAQVASMLDVVNRVALSQLPRASGVAMLVGAFGLTADSAEAIMGEVGRGFTPKPPVEPTPAPVTAGLDATTDTTVPPVTEVATPPAPDTTTAAPVIMHPFTKDQLDSHWKQMTEQGLESLYDSRRTEVVDFYGRLGKLYKKAFEKNLKKFGVSYKAGKDDIVDDAALQDLLDAEADKIVNGSLSDSSKYGFEKTLVEVKMGYPDEYAKEALAKTAADNVKHVSDSVREDMYLILNSGVEEATSLSEISSQMRDYFGEELSKGRADRIVRTEVLQAVSVGQDTKTKEFKKEFPKEAKRLKKIWISSRDDRVRGNPDGLYPVVNRDDADHYTPDGEVKDYDEPFSTGLMFPREPGGEAKNIINCRCTWLTFLAEDAADIQEIVSEGSPAADVKSISLPPRRWGKK